MYKFVFFDGFYVSVNLDNLPQLAVMAVCLFMFLAVVFRILRGLYRGFSGNKHHHTKMLNRPVPTSEWSDSDAIDSDVKIIEVNRINDYHDWINANGINCGFADFSMKDK
ncbi:hypothetical protein ABT56_19125 [Photobacterium aquae]|uniref:Uncharacterized protein n=1 Tax=Photobacterium aquae TaxID=1195763 RepID=A0A0J1JMZ7_9GAMM|nr:hypothetical protein [Photobacterium aquae]KLV03542.1 hypothetical protein ABT56_19125 [Photobacterium aquae]